VLAGTSLQRSLFAFPQQRYCMPLPSPNQLLAERLVQLSSECFAAAGEANDSAVPWYNPNHTVLEALEPDGTPEDPHSANWTVHPEGQWILGNHPDLSAQDKQALQDMLMSNKGAFAYSLKELPGYNGEPITFELIDPNKRMWSPPRTFTPEENTFGDGKVNEMLDANISVELPTTNKHASAVTLPMKRAPDGSWSDKRFCVDMRKVNSNTARDKYGVPLPEDLFRQMRGARFFSKVDLRSGFWQLRLSEEAQKQVAYWWRGKLYTFTRLPFGHVNATAIFQRVMEYELQRACLSHCSCVFVDDVCIYSNTFAEHIQQLSTLFKHFEKVGLRAHPAKSIVAADCIPYLGHIISSKDLRPEPAKIAAMQASNPLPLSSSCNHTWGCSTTTVVMCLTSV
jgi:hypothetical protein